MKNVLSIAGSDCSAGAGIQADLKTFAALGVYGLSVITSITAQNTQEVRMIENVSEKMLKNQIDVIFEDIKVDAVKIGMINSRENAEIIYEKLLKHKAENIVIDPVMISTSGRQLLDEEAKKFLINKLFKIADLITPNLDETKEIIKCIFKEKNLIDKIQVKEKIETKKNVLLELEKIDNIEKMKICGRIISNFTGHWVLIKGGHLLTEAVDILANLNEIHIIGGERIESKNTHGTGCTLSSSIAVNLAKGYSMLEAVQKSKKFISSAIKNSIDFGKGNGPVNQMGEIYKNIDIEKLYD